MTEIEKALEPKAEGSRRQLPKGWLILTGILILLILITLGVGKFKEGQAIKQLNEAKKQYSAMLQKERKAYNDTLNAIIEEKGRAIATALKMLDPQILNSRGQERTNTLIQNLLKDPYIAYVVLRDEDGSVVAQGSQLSRESSVPKMTDVTVSKADTFSANIDVQGPIEDSRGRQIGIVRIGLTLKPAQGKYTVGKPSGTGRNDASVFPESAPPAAPATPPTTDTGTDAAPLAGQ